MATLNETTVNGNLTVTGSVTISPNNSSTAGKGLDKVILDAVYPVGSIYISTKFKSPASFVGGEWTRLTSGQAIIGAGSSYSATLTGGYWDAIVPEHTHILHSPSALHSHSLTNHTHTLQNNNTSSSGNNYFEYANRAVANATTRATQNAEFWSDYAYGGTITIGSCISKDSTDCISNTTPITTVSSGTNLNLPRYKLVYMWRREG